MDFHGPLTRSTTPKSAPLVGPSKPSISKPKENRNKCNLFTKNSEKPQKPEKPISRKARKNNNNPSCLYQWQSGKKPRSTTGQQSKNSSVSNSSGVSANELESGLVVKGLVELKPSANEENFTPLAKIATGFSVDCRAENAMGDNSSKSKSKTPPIQASVSPEINYGSSVVSTTTPACYGAGHVVSGITDKRKCRARGLLAVGENDLGFVKGKALGSSDYGDDDDDDDETVKGAFANSDASLVPLPTEASMHWLLSPCSEDDGSKKENAENGSCQSKSLAGSIGLHSPFSPSCTHEFSSDAGKTSSSSRKNVRMNSPGGLPEFRELLEPLNHHIPVLSFPHRTHDYGASTLKEGIKFPYDLDGEKSPFSMNSLGSGNVILTPGSDSSSDRYADLIRLSTDNFNKNKFDSELDSVVEDLQKTSLSPNSLESIRDSIDFSFLLDSISTSCSSVDLNRFKQVLDDHASWNSCSTLGNESQSQMRISWREGLMSQIYEMDEFDCCRCLSDEEEETNGCSNDQLQFSDASDINANTSSSQILTESDCFSAKILDNEPRVEEKGQENFPSGTPQISHSCAESISTDGGSLLASADSGWDLCYKNELFQV